MVVGTDLRGRFISDMRCYCRINRRRVIRVELFLRKFGKRSVRLMSWRLAGIRLICRRPRNMTWRILSGVEFSSRIGFRTVFLLLMLIVVGGLFGMDLVNRLGT